MITSKRAPAVPFSCCQYEVRVHGEYPGEDNFYSPESERQLAQAPQPRVSNLNNCMPSPLYQSLCSDP